MYPKYIIIRLVLASLFFFAFASNASGDSISDQARRHMIRGQAAISLAKTPDDYNLAIKEFKQAIKYAPTWPDAYYNLGVAQDKAEQYEAAMISFKKYLSLAPKAQDVAEVRDILYGLEFKAEHSKKNKYIDILVGTEWFSEGGPVTTNYPERFPFKFRKYGDQIQIGFSTHYYTDGGRAYKEANFVWKTVKIDGNKLFFEHNFFIGYPVRKSRSNNEYNFTIINSRRMKGKRKIVWETTSTGHFQKPRYFDAELFAR